MYNAVVQCTQDCSESYKMSVMWEENVGVYVKMLVHDACTLWNVRIAGLSYLALIWRSEKGLCKF